jgi:hypothetical protein
VSCRRYSDDLNTYIDNFFIEKERLGEHYELIGFLGITHIKNNGVLTEIPRKEFEIGDVIYSEETKETLVFMKLRKNDNDFEVREGAGLDVAEFFSEKYGSILFEDDYAEALKNYKKIGILGVNYEFIIEKSEG